MDLEMGHSWEALCMPDGTLLVPFRDCKDQQACVLKRPTGSRRGEFYADLDDMKTVRNAMAVVSLSRPARFDWRSFSRSAPPTDAQLEEAAHKSCPVRFDDPRSRGQGRRG